MKIVQMQSNGIRTANYHEGFGHCMECKHLVSHGGEYRCTMRTKASFLDSRFPYDNTKCKEFDDGSKKQ